MYIKISEAEIADDYPEPEQYDKVHSYHTNRIGAAAALSRLYTD